MHIIQLHPLINHNINSEEIKIRYKSYSQFTGNYCTYMISYKAKDATKC